MRLRLACMVIASLLSGLPAAAADRLQGIATLRGACTSLRLLEYDFTKGCAATLSNEIFASGRVDFTFATRPGTTVTFSGIGAQVKQGDNAAIQPVDRVIWKFEAGAPAHAIPAVGKCRYTNPNVGKAIIACEASASDGAYRATFATDGSPPVLREF